MKDNHLDVGLVGLSRTLETQGAALRAARRPFLGEVAFFDSARSIADQLNRVTRDFGLQVTAVRAAMPSSLAAAELNGGLISSLQAAVNAFQGDLRPLRCAVEESERNFRQLVGPTLASARLAAQLEALRPTANPLLDPLRLGTTSLASAAQGIRVELCRLATLIPAPATWLTYAPTIEPYVATRLLGVVQGAGWEIIEDAKDPEAEGLLDEHGSEVEARLAVVSPALIEPYRGALAALQARNPDWCRHASVSVRELMDHLLELLAPDEQLRSHFGSEAAAHIENGKFKRKAQLHFIFRHVAVGAYERMAEIDIELIAATFYPANSGVHTLVPALTEPQMKVFLARVRGCLLTLLAAAGERT